MPSGIFGSIGNLDILRWMRAHCVDQFPTPLKLEIRKRTFGITKHDRMKRNESRGRHSIGAVKWIYIFSNQLNAIAWQGVTPEIVSDRIQNLITRSARCIVLPIDRT